MRALGRLRLRSHPPLPSSSPEAALGASTQPPIHPCAPIPPVEQSHVCIDFDGTLTQSDLLDVLITKYAKDASWRDAEERWQAGEIGSRDCLQLQLALVRIDEATLNRELAAVRLDPGAANLLHFCAQHAAPVTILSDGIERFIRTILLNHGVTPPPIRANRVAHLGDQFQFSCPHFSDLCVSRSAHCKCASAEAVRPRGRATIYVGDGRSDLCASRHTDVVFAKGTLARLMRAEHREFYPFTTLADVQFVLHQSWAAASAAQDAMRLTALAHKEPA